ncbi:MAG: hypothetical protein RI967_1375 [Planctomycetota bacterium]|jgi:tryptophan synthase alpha subunit
MRLLHPAQVERLVDRSPGAGIDAILLVDLTVDADDNASLAIEGNETVPIRLVGSTAPRRLAP